MPSFDLDIDVEEFVDSCSSWERKQLIKYLSSIPGEIDESDFNPKSVIDAQWEASLSKLKTQRHQLTAEEEELIHKIANRL
jgi:hypothetical protein